MYEHPYLTHLVSQVDLERQVVMIERARAAREHPERLVPRRSWMDRMLHRTRTARPDPTARETSAASATAGRMATDVA